MLIDSHCHLDRLKVTPREAVEDARKRGVTEMMCIGVDLPNMHKVLAVADAFSDVYASVGIHPLSVDSESVISEVEELAQHPKVLAIGESGLDYFYEKDEAKRADQRRSFMEHLELSVQTKKPIVVHTRDAERDTLDAIERAGDPSIGGILHCFTERMEMAEAAMAMGYYVSISGIVTFGNADNVRTIAKEVPLDRLLIETDAPWLTPAPNRGKANLPGYVRDVAEYVAQLRGITFEELAKLTSENFYRLTGRS